MHSSANNGQIGTGFVTIKPRKAPDAMVEKSNELDWDGMTKGCEGEAAIWANLARNGSLMFRAKPPHYKRPGQIVNLADVQFSIPSTGITQSLSDRLVQKATECDAFQAAKQATAEARAIIRIEADMVRV